MCSRLCAKVSCRHKNVDAEFLNFGQYSLFCSNKQIKWVLTSTNSHPVQELLINSSTWSRNSNLKRLYYCLHISESYVICLGFYVVDSTVRTSSQQLQMWFSEHFSRQNLLRCLSRLLFLLRWNNMARKNVWQITFHSTSEMIQL